MEPIRGRNEINDPFYRYKMHKLVLQKERTKTVITNMKEISNDIKIPSYTLILLYIKKKLSLSITDNQKEGRITITNDVDKNLLQNALYEFIEYFVLCKQCMLPELEYGIDKKHLITHCKSCGKVSNIEENNNTEKVIKSFETFIKK